MDEIAKILCLDKIYPGNSYPDYSYEILRRSIDARKKPDIYFVYTLAVLTGSEDEKKITRYLRTHSKDARVKRSSARILTDPVIEYEIPENSGDKPCRRPVIAGSGPAGLFCALALAKRGFAPLVIERGQSVDERTKSVERFWKTGELDEHSNVQFGEGGAGTFSDGKLNTLTKDTNGRNTFVLKTFAKHGAADETVYDAKPHIGTDVLKSVVKNIRKEIEALGGTFMFKTFIADLGIDDGRITSVTVKDADGRTQNIDTDICILCIGHSARDTFEMLYEKGVPMAPKSFAVGFRVIHPQSFVDKWQYGVEKASSAGLAPADYKVTNETSKGRRVFSFCMCPGGYVVNASSEDGRLCVNGMSESKRDGEYANSAIIVAVDPDDFAQKEVAPGHSLAGMYYQRNIEEAAFSRGEGKIPAQLFTEFENDTVSSDLKDLTGAVKGGYTHANLRGIFSGEIDEAVIESMNKFGYTREGFDKEEAVMLGIESRTSSPVRIMRDDSYESQIRGLYPCGEGAGYAGGIMSAACDGLKVAESIIKKFYFEG